MSAFARDQMQLQDSGAWGRGISTAACFLAVLSTPLLRRYCSGTEAKGHLVVVLLDCIPVEIEVLERMKGIYIWSSAVPGTAQATEPGELKGMSPLWASDLDSLEQWLEVYLTAACPHDRWWRAGSVLADTLIVVAGPCSSSLDLSWALVRRGLLTEWDSLLVVSQWSGRGRQGRVWHSPAGNVYAALRLPYPALPCLDSLPLITGCILVEAFAELGLEVKIKWPNDLMLNRKKVGGILIEQQGGVIMAGVGINLVSAPETSMLRDEQAMPTCCLAEFGYQATPLHLWRQLADGARIRYAEAMACRAPSLLLSRVEKHLAFLNEEVIVDPPGEQSYRATVLGVAACGGLKVHAGGKDRVIRYADMYPVAN